MNQIWRSRCYRYLIEPAGEISTRVYNFFKKRPKKGKALAYWKLFASTYSVLAGIWIFIALLILNGGI